MEEMAKIPGLTRRGDVFYLRKRIPEDIRRLIADDFSIWRQLSLHPGARLSAWKSIAPKKTKVRPFFERSLKTKDPRQAKVAYHDLSAQLEDIYQTIRAAYGGLARKPSDGNLRRLAGQYFARRDHENDLEISSLVGSGADMKDARWTEVEDLGALNPEDPVCVGRFQATARTVLTSAEFDTNPEAVKMLSGYLLRAERLRHARNIERFDQNFTALPEDPLFGSGTTAGATISAPGEKQSLTLEEAYSEYRRRSETDGSHDKTHGKFDYVWRLLSDIHGSDFPVRKYDRAEARKFQDIVTALPAGWSKKPELRELTAPTALEKARELGLKPCHPNTAKGYISRLSTFFAFLEREDIVDKNIARGLLPKEKFKRNRRTRLSFTTKELQRIFEPNYSQIAQERGRTKKAPRIHGLPTDARFWAPLISLFTGMRISEICQLTKDEIRQIDGVWCIGVTWFLEEDEIEDETDDVERSLKTEAAERFIPIAGELLKIGLLELHGRTPGDPQQRIFGHLTPNKQGYLAEPVSRWFARHLDHHGITSKRKVFHSFRHTFRDALRNAKVDRDVVLRIGGWHSSETSDLYGGGSEAQLAKEELSRVRYSGLDLSHLYYRA